MKIRIEEQKMLDVATARARFELAIKEQAQFLKTYRNMTDSALVALRAKRIELTVKSAKRALEAAEAARDGLKK